METIVQVRPCGWGKTKQACEYAAIEAATGRSVLYIVPTRSLLLEVAERISQAGARVLIAAGRSTDREPVNCRNPLADLSDACGFSLLTFCQACPHSRGCSYLDGRLMLIPRGTVCVTTVHFLVWNRIPANQVDIVICDEMPQLIEIDARYEHLLPEQSRALALRLSAMPRRIRREVKRYYARSGVEPPRAFLLPRIPRGRERTLILTATPVPGLIEHMVAGEVVYDAPQGFWSLDQRVEWFYEILSHSKDWEPEGAGCGFKKNTRHGLPYFRASIGLNRWRGESLRVYGSFQPPPHVWLVLAWATRARIKIDPVDVLFDVPPQDDPLRIGPRGKIPSFTLSFVYGSGKTIPVPWLTQAADLAQLLGRSGMNVTNAYVGSIPVVAKNTVWSYRLAREVALAGYSAFDVALTILTHYMLFHRRPVDAVIRAYPELAGLLDESLLSAARARARLARAIAQIASPEGEEQEDEDE